MTFPLRLHAHDQPADADDRLLLSVRDLAAMLSCGMRTVRSWDAAGKLPRPIRIGSSVRWRADEIRSWIAAECPDRQTWEKIKRSGK